MAAKLASVKGKDSLELLAWNSILDTYPSAASAKEHYQMAKQRFVDAFPRSRARLSSTDVGSKFRPSINRLKTFARKPIPVILDGVLKEYVALFAKGKGEIDIKFVPKRASAEETVTRFYAAVQKERYDVAWQFLSVAYHQRWQNNYERFLDGYAFQRGVESIRVLTVEEGENAAECIVLFDEVHECFKIAEVEGPNSLTLGSSPEEIDSALGALKSRLLSLGGDPTEVERLPLNVIFRDDAVATLVWLTKGSSKLVVEKYHKRQTKKFRRALTFYMVWTENDWRINKIDYIRP